MATDLAESYRAGLTPHLAHAVRVADPLHVVRVANRCVKGTFDIVLNEQSSRRTPTMISFFEGDRYLGNEARSLVRRRCAECTRLFDDTATRCVGHEDAKHNSFVPEHVARS